MFNSWVNTGIKTQFALTNSLGDAFPIIYNIPPIGSFDISDIKVEYSSIPTRWTQHPSEVYGKKFYMDESGFNITTGQNNMNIDEDSILATYGDTTVFGISGDKTILNIAKLNEIQIDQFVLNTQTINSTKYLILN